MMQVDVGPLTKDYLLLCESFLTALSNRFSDCVSIGFLRTESASAESPLTRLLAVSDDAADPVGHTLFSLSVRSLDLEEDAALSRVHANGVGG